MTEANEHPPWCTREETLQSLTRHRSNEVRVGTWRRPANGGQVSARLTSAYDGPPAIAVNVWIGVGVTASISLEQAEAFRDGLTQLLNLAGRG
ncbi:hypothetical protein ACWT_5821 [Actinoplanes sp. SE50]|uniref:hypothetical protein n=1 Tax=unclassified Actinoplanes TaxID=2626549 RepID=UPI00023EBC18|nr:MULTISPECIES: hypothetical protein [unclassified Actinoplanes]AEV86839.1 hypothetical protein ACPL_5952 [Actinoplanes sp. SE50/110]ATO85236.1 hypothetical protein ACWT_5821 [Actinoplanes sp. SE50]SLM02646.1 hypothetical protein ACSP50_5928 [Actinoplanes sp. SE50/110]